jgi:hypothetical protein
MQDAPYRLIPLHRRDGSVRAEAIVDVEDFERFGGFRWSLNSNGYAVRGGGTILLHREVLGLSPGDGLEGDHKDGNKLDYRRSNLRIATPALNRQNRVALDPRNTSGYRGVYWHKQRRKWMAYAGLKGRSYNLGLFTEARDAAEAAAAFRAAHMPFATN